YMGGNKKLIQVKTIIILLFILITVLIGYSSKLIYNSKTDQYKNNIYKKVDQDILERFDVMLNEKLNTSLLVSSSLSKNEKIKEALLKNNASILDMDKLLDEMRTKKEYADIQAEVIDAEGMSFKRSWTHLSGDDLVRNDSQMAHLIKYPRVYTTIQASKYGLTFTNKIPIYEGERFLGLFGVNIHFDALAEVFASEGYKIVILLNKEDSKNIQQDISHSKKFLDDCYVVNANADNYLLRVIKEKGVENFCSQNSKEYLVDQRSDQLISKYFIKDHNSQIVANAIIFKLIDEIDMGDLGLMQKAHIVLTVFFIILLLFLTKFFTISKDVKAIQQENDALILENTELQKKADALDYKQKELDNLFDNQPNLMFMHNGKAITKVNRRFIKGFFRRFKTYEGFRSQHACVSELFENFEGENYITRQVVDGKYWIDYILDDPRKLYKVVMSVDGEAHHFIVKLNEMEFNKKSSERVIIVALVDVTQDILANRLSSQSIAQAQSSVETLSNQILETTKQKEQLEIAKEKNLQEIDTVEITTPVKSTVVENNLAQKQDSIDKEIPNDSKLQETDDKEKNKVVEATVEEIKTDQEAKSEQTPTKQITKFNPYKLIEKTTQIAMKKLLDEKLRLESTFNISISAFDPNMQGIVYFNSFVFADELMSNQNWKLFISAESLSVMHSIVLNESFDDLDNTKMDEGLKDFANHIVALTKNFIAVATSKKVTMVVNKSAILNISQLNEDQMYELKFKVKKQYCSIYMILNEGV
ncbi:MAG: hypothetical protein IE909_05725, partial [Campylobacterales bacterium]|nr:hypothetical protein [Campylobacterales bacterium]